MSDNGAESEFRENVIGFWYIYECNIFIV